MTKQTVLNAAHRALGAKMVDFGGWDMPLHYGSQIEEHHAVRRECGMFDVSHMCAVDVSGPDAHAFLLRLIANNVDKLKVPGKALYSAMLNEAGGVVDDLIVYYLTDTHYRVVINAGTAEKDIAWIRAQNDATASGLTITQRRDGAPGAPADPRGRQGQRQCHTGEEERVGRGDDALQWFIHAAAADLDGVTDAEDRVSELA